MIRSFVKFSMSAAVLAVFTAVGALPVFAFQLVTPTPEQVVRENVKITIPASVLPSNFFEKGAQERPFIGISVGAQGAEQFVTALSAGSVVRRGDKVVFFWDSKAPYRDPKDPKQDKVFKDGKYSLKVEVYDQNGQSAIVADSGYVDVVLKNKVARTNPAPGVSLVNQLTYGQQSVYRLYAGVQIYDNAGLPVLGNLGVSAYTKIIQSVEDIRSDGNLLLRCRLDEDSYVSLFGRKIPLFEGQTIMPQLYRLITKYGEVKKRNTFSKQAKYSITDTLPLLPDRAVKEGDSWPDSMALKVEGITDTIDLTGTCMLDSFEWHRGQQCVKMISQMNGAGRVSFNSGKIHSIGGSVSAKVVTYFAYRSGKMLSREISLEFPVAIESGAGDSEATAATPSAPVVTNFNDDDEEDSPTKKRSSTVVGGSKSSAAASKSTAKKGSASMDIVLQLEK